MLNKKIVLIAFCFFAGTTFSCASEKLKQLSVEAGPQVGIAAYDFTTYKSLSESLQKNIELQDNLIAQLKECNDALDLHHRRAECRLVILNAQNAILQEQITTIISKIGRYGVRVGIDGKEVNLGRMSRAARSHLRQAATRDIYLKVAAPKDFKGAQVTKLDE